jgi:MFS family permease
VAAVVLLNILPVLDNSYYNAASTGKMIAFIVILGLLLVSMGTYRSPAVALMPDVTPKPLRSRANAIINLMGAVGGIIYYLVIVIVLWLKLDSNYLKLLTAVVVAVFLAVPNIQTKMKTSFSRAGKRSVKSTKEAK